MHSLPFEEFPGYAELVWMGMYEPLLSCLQDLDEIASEIEQKMLTNDPFTWGQHNRWLFFFRISDFRNLGGGVGFMLGFYISI